VKQQKIHKHSHGKQTLLEEGLAPVARVNPRAPPVRTIIQVFLLDPGLIFHGPGLEPPLELCGGHIQATQYWPALYQIPLAKWRPFNSPRLCGSRWTGCWEFGLPVESRIISTIPLQRRACHKTFLPKSGICTHSVR